MLDTQAIMDYRRELGDWDEPECSHPVADRWPFWPGWHICGQCGEIVRPADFIPVWETDFMNYTEETK